MSLSPFSWRKLPRSCFASAIYVPLSPLPSLHNPLLLPSPALTAFPLRLPAAPPPPSIAAMKLIKITKLSPKRLFGSKKSVSRSEPSSFSSGSMSSSDEATSSSVHKGGSGYDRTPVSVLPTDAEWSDTDMNFELFQFRSSKSIDRESGGYGVVSRAELEALLSRLGAEPPASRDEAALMMREAGCGDDDDSCLSVDELLGQQGPVCDEELRETFEFFDADRDGRITAEELLGVFTTVLGDERCTLEDCRRMIAEVDSNGDGFVCFEDFTRMMGLQI